MLHLLTPERTSTANYPLPGYMHQYKNRERPSDRKLKFLLALALMARALHADAILPYDDPGPPAMQLIFLLNSVKSALESYCLTRDQRPLCTELRLMGQKLRQLREGKPVEAIGSLSDVRSRVHTIEDELQRQQWDRDILGE
jgi:hypothetical protein